MTQAAREGRGGEGDFSAGNIFHDVAATKKTPRSDHSERFDMN